MKFLLKDQFDLARDTKIRNVQTNPDGTIVVRFDDSATFGGTSKVTLHFDARRNRLKEWTVVDPQGYETTIVLSDGRDPGCRRLKEAPVLRPPPAPTRRPAIRAGDVS